MTADAVLSKLDKVRRTSAGRWIACCPAHDDRHPSLSVRDVGDGRTQIHCFSGCDAADVLAALGLNWSALYPPRTNSEKRHFRREYVANAADALRCLGFEAAVVMVAAGDMAQGKALSEADHARVVLAARRIADARQVCNV